MAAKDERIVALRAHLLVFVLASGCLGFLCCLYGVKLGEVYDKLRNDDFRLPDEARDLLSGRAAAETTEETPTRSRRAAEGGYHYYRLAGTKVQPVMGVFESCIEALKVAVNLCYATATVSFLAAAWFVAAHVLVFERQLATAAAKAISWVAYLGFSAVVCVALFFLSTQMALLPVLRALAALLPLEIANERLYDGFQLSSKTLAPFIMANMFAVLQLTAWFQSRIVNVEIYSSVYETREMQSPTRQAKRQAAPA